MKPTTSTRRPGPADATLSASIEENVLHTVLRPATDWELARYVRDAIEQQKPVEIVGSGSKRGIGRPTHAATVVSPCIMRSVKLYEPSELVMAAEAGVLVSDIEAELENNGQMLAFEPVDLGPVLDKPAGRGTVGGMFAVDISGSRRIAAGSGRDHLLGVRAVSGIGQIFKSGGRVLKDVTGIGLTRAVAGSWGTLGVITEATFKVLPRPEMTATLVIIGLSNEIAVEAMCAALATPFEVTGAVHLELPLVERLNSDAFRSAANSITALRLENFSKFLPRRMERLQEALKTYGEVHVIGNEDSLFFWNELRQLSPMIGRTEQLWRISTLPNKGALLVSDIQRYREAEAFFDWSGGLIWLSIPQAADAGASDIRRALAAYGGHATLIRADEEVRSNVEIFQPLDHGTERMTRNIKQAFDPAGILNKGRMYANI